MMQLIIGCTLALWLARNLWHYILTLKYFQLHEYDEFRFFIWSINNYHRVFWYFDVVILIIFIALSVLRDAISLEISISTLLVAIILAIPLDWMQYSQRKIKEAQRLVYTARAKRLIFTGLLTYILGLFLLFKIFRIPLYSSEFALDPEPLLVTLFAWWGIGLLTFVVVILSNFFLFPIEYSLRFYYVFSARKVLKKVKPFVIGITGSYGKTTTKEILAHLLGTKYRVLKTPKSYNTLMGICKVIREELKPGHEYFVVEMGAYKRGEIARICDLVKPNIGILTAIGPQHLERFKTLENITKAKFELFDSLPQEGVAIFNVDYPIASDLSNQVRTKVLRYGLICGKDDLDLTAKDLEFDGSGTRFMVCPKNVPPSQVKMRLLGPHNVSNTLAAMLAALECGLSMKEIIASLAIMSPFEHRLQPIRSENNITFIDDSYNSNPVGSKIALEVLANFKGKRKILVTPGMVELGELEAQENYTFGENAAKVCDLIILVGNKKHIEPILKGARDMNFPSSQIFLCETMKEARQRLAQNLQPGDVVLFENDLPDIY